MVNGRAAAAEAARNFGEPLLSVQNLTVTYERVGQTVVAVDDVSFDIWPGEIFGLAGESGCGKSTVASAIMRLLKSSGRVSSGSIWFKGANVLAMNPEELRQFRWQETAMVFQSAMNSLNPVMTVGAQIADVLWTHKGIRRQEAGIRGLELLELVGIDPSRIGSYPHQLSGGMRQRAVIAIALALNPALLIMDEPTTALDVVVQQEILQNIQNLKQTLNFAVLFITHDVSLMLQLTSQMAVMYAGKLVEVSATGNMLDGALHPYSQALLAAFPPLTGPRLPLVGIPDAPPNMAHPPSGCRFHPRCPFAFDRCREEVPKLIESEHQHAAACHLVGDVAGSPASIGGSR
ncbi:ABC transporter ATP-binding protein [Glaciihabitans sp. INWT7]|uniref:ABC transporter ATP-binding protein n=1 Tax=Glaciihabitans sp. INWT7 TaxID=2596912 RepID=UPI001628B20B|nr:ABC transporter ATP-binding protein [Glaciihabitans sp. INWT7]QNE46185.1 ABC transporter ATP-binding protein [Glaciihabitans sp. INWT7]